MFYLMIVATLLLLYFVPQLVTFLPHQMKFSLSASGGLSE